MKPAERIESLKRHLARVEFQATKAIGTKQTWYALEIKRTKAKIEALGIK